MINPKHPKATYGYSQVTLVVFQTLGLAFAHAWNWAVLFSPFIFSSTGTLSGILINVSVSSYLLAMLLTVLLTNRLLTKLGSAPKARISTILALLSLAILIDNAFPLQGQWSVLRIALWFIGGIGTSSLFFLWESRLPDEDAREKRDSYLHMAITSLIGGIFLLFLAFMQSESRIVVLALFVALSVLFALFGTRRHGDYAEVEKGHTISRPVDRLSNEVFSWRVFLFIMGYSLLLGYAAYYCHTSFLAGSFLAPYIGVTFVVSALVMIIVSYNNITQEASVNMIRFFMPTSILLISLILFGPLFAQVGVYLIIIVFSVYTQMSFGTAVDKSTYAVVPEHAFLPTRFSGLSGVLLGWLLGIFSVRLPVDQLISVIVMIMVLVLISVLGIRKTLWITQKETSEANDHEDEAVAYHTSRPGSYTAICQKISQEYGLTERQTEILKLLGKGRNAHFIRSELYISEKTVRTHIYNIYRKLNVHSQQDLLNLIDSVGKAQQSMKNDEVSQVFEHRREQIFVAR